MMKPGQTLNVVASGSGKSIFWSNGMNERIRELAEQAFFDDATSQPSDRMYTFSDHKMQKFAELIVRECISQIDAQCFPTQSHELVQKGAWNAYLRTTIKQHFGVE